MKPLNRKERRIAFMKFMGVFLLAIAIVIGTAFVLGMKVPPAACSLQDQKCGNAQILAQHLGDLRVTIETLQAQDITLAGETNREKQKPIRTEIRRLEGEYQIKVENIRRLPESALKQDLVTVAAAYLTLRSVEQETEPTPEPCDCGNIVNTANRNIEKLKGINELGVTELENIRDEINLFNLDKNKLKNKINQVIKKLEKGDYIQEVTD